ncbi:MAG: InlB B-repeat-containing protein [Spirochaetes bacterium]|nr:InlB B-repeat-containing protein [Spirochaetota bacterium]MBN2770635.1 InlB B-repeat-containing protein [Spirochaetota bacterium]
MKMKKILWALLSVLLVSGMLALTACGGGGDGTDDKDPGTKDPGITDDTDDTDEEEAITTFTVTFETGCGINPDGTEDLVVKEGETVPRVDEEKFLEATKEVKAGFYFDGWYSDKEFTKRWNFKTDKVENDLALTANWLLATDGLSYTFVTDHYEITNKGSADFSSNNCIIPGYFDDGSNGYHPVTTLGNNVFQDESDIIYVYLPPTIENIGLLTFANCSLEIVYCRAIEPPNGTSSMFNGFTEEEGHIIYIPNGSFNLYAYNSIWTNYYQFLKEY